MSKHQESTTMDKIISLCKRRGFIFPSSEIYGGLGAVYDWGPLGVELVNNIKKEWWRMFVRERADMVGLDAAILMNPKVWEASGHVKNFSDALAECKKCHQRFRADHLLEMRSAQPGYDKEEPIDWQKINPTPSCEILDPAGQGILGRCGIKCPECGGELTSAKHFSLMFKTFVGPVEDSASVVYLRPETAGGIFANYKNVLQTSRQKIPFGIGQIGKAFRNEITVENYIFRIREFEQMEVEYFIHPNPPAGGWQKYFDEWLEVMKKWCRFIGLKDSNLVFHEIPEAERAFYSKKTIDIEYKYPFGTKELYGLAYRTNYDLFQHQKFSNEDLTYTDPETKEKYLPHVIEPSLGMPRTVLAVLLESYEEIKGGRTTTTESNKEEEVVLRLPYALAPVKVAVLPLSKKEPLAKMAQEISQTLRPYWNIQYDEVGSIGRRYRRQDEIGTPYCVTVDFESLDDKRVTFRDRDSMKQERIDISRVLEYCKEKL